MSQATQTDNLSIYRKNMYLFLSRVFAYEIDADILEKIKEVCHTAKATDEEIKNVYQMLGQYLDAPHQDVIVTLAEDYALIFLGAGLNDQMAAFPYASVYTSKKRLLAQDILDQIAETYRKKNLTLTNVPMGYMEDHISCEMEFMAYLCACEGEGSPELKKEQAEFLQKYVFNWIPDFCKDIKKLAKTTFYQCMATLLENYIQMDACWLAESES